MKRLLIPLAVLLGVLPALGAEPKWEVTPGKYMTEVRVKDVPKGTAIIWDVYPRETCQKKVVKTEQSCTIAGVPGEYEVVVRLVFKAGDDFDVEEYSRKVVVGGGGPTPPTPVPPTPTPEPTDPLFKPIKAAWEKGKDPVALAQLVKVYKAAAATDLSLFRTAGELRSALKDKVRENDLSEDALRPVREAIQGELDQFLPLKADAALTQDHRANAKSCFARILTCLEALK